MMNDTHSKIVGYVLWLFGFTGAHRFYYGKPITGTIWLLSFGVFGIGWLIDAFLIPSMDNAMDKRFKSGAINYTLAWILLTLFGVFGLHRLYLGQWLTGSIMLITSLSLLGISIVLPFMAWLILLVYFLLIYDFCTLNTRIHQLNQ